MNLVQRLFSVFNNLKLPMKLVVIVAMTTLYHIASLQFQFDAAANRWIEDTHGVDVIVNFFTPTEVEIALAFTMLLTIFSTSLTLAYIRRKHIELNDIKLGLQNNEFEVVLQPKKFLKDKSVKGAECLLRWNHKKYGIVMPDQFIPIVEADAKTMNALTEYVVLHAAETYAKLKDAGFDVEIAINVSATNMSDVTIIESITTALMQHQTPMEKLVLEVTETAIMKQPEIAIKVLVILDSLGARISLDNFGTGHSSFLYLKHFPVREIKIDRSFICELTTNIHKRSIVRSTIQLAHDIGARVVAEGVENKETQKILAELECDYVQGCYVAMPMTVDEMVDWLKSNNEIHNDATLKVPPYKG